MEDSLVPIEVSVIKNARNYSNLPLFPLLQYEDVKIAVPWGFVVGRWYGNRQERPILALHGWQDNLSTWDRLIPLLPQHIGVLCIDLPGHGRSSKYPKGITYHVIDYVHIIIRIVKEYKWRKVSLLGHSMGGIVCFMYTTLFPHTVDMLVQIDIFKQPSRGNDALISRMAASAEKSIMENERLDQLHLEEPPCYTYEEMEELLYRGSNDWVDRENCKYILNRNIAPSQMHPGKFYFSRDGRLKYYQEFSDEVGLALEMVKRLKNVNYLIVRAIDSFSMDDELLNEVRSVLKNNANFEIQETEGRHHVHLNNPVGVANFMVPFILKHRPVPLHSWSVDDEQSKNKIKYSKL